MAKIRIRMRAKHATTTLPRRSEEKPPHDTEESKQKTAAGREISPKETRAEDGGFRKWPLSWKSREESGGKTVGWGSPYSGNRRRGRPDGRLWAIVKAVGGAVLLGSLMGALIMSLFFSGDADVSNWSIDSHLQKVPGKEEESETGTTKKKEATDQKKGSLPKLEAVLVQAGTFKEEPNALKKVREYRSQGMAAVTTEQAPYRIYRGVGMNKKEAEALSSSLQEKGADLHLKPIRVADKPVSLADWTNDDKERKALSDMIEEGHEVFRLMGEKSTTGLRQGKDSVSFESVWQDVFSKYSEVAQKAPKMEKSLPKEATPHLVQMVRALDQVVQNSRTYQKDPETVTLWQIQEGLVRYALAYENFLEAFR